jgi:hypothetical protein
MTDTIEFPAIQSPASRRSHARHETRWWASFAIGAEHLDCYVYNVSLGGAKLLLFGAVTGQTAALFIPPFGVFQCEVRWVTYTFVGVEFARFERHRTGSLVAHALKSSHRAEIPPLAELIAEGSAAGAGFLHPEHD